MYLTQSASTGAETLRSGALPRSCLARQAGVRADARPGPYGGTPADAGLRPSAGPASRAPHPPRQPVLVEGRSLASAQCPPQRRVADAVRVSDHVALTRSSPRAPPIRWDARTVLRARGSARFLDDSHQRINIAAREEEERDAVILADPARRQLTPAVPSEIETEADLQRWHLAVAVARHRASAARAEELWDIARDLWATAGADALRGEHASIPPPRDTRAEQFRVAEGLVRETAEPTIESVAKHSRRSFARGPILGRRCTHPGQGARGDQSDHRR